jgi:hypothetical protein
LVAYVERGARRILTFANPSPELVANALAEVARTRRQTTIETIDGEPASSGPIGTALRGSGFSVGYKGLTFRPKQRGRR